MLKKIALLIVVFTTPLILAQGTSAPTKHAYVGAAVCGMCHHTEKQGKQLDIWKASAHAKAYETLKTAEADSIAKAKGLTTKAVESEACLKCHVSGYNVDASLKGDKFKMEDGVQCETCHGPGGDYKTLKVMKSKDDAIANGLLFYNTEADRVALCKDCHNSESPTFNEKTANFTEMWDKIKHTIPAGN
jgi:Cytochrome c554 and c-prime